MTWYRTLRTLLYIPLVAALAIVVLYTYTRRETNTLPVFIILERVPDPILRVPQDGSRTSTNNTKGERIELVTEPGPTLRISEVFTTGSPTIDRLTSDFSREEVSLAKEEREGILATEEGNSATVRTTEGNSATVRTTANSATVRTTANSATVRTTANSATVRTTANSPRVRTTGNSPTVRTTANLATVRTTEGNSATVRTTANSRAHVGKEEGKERGEKTEIRSQPVAAERTEEVITNVPTTNNLVSMASTQQSQSSVHGNVTSRNVFTISKPFAFPHPIAFRHTADILASGWVSDLKDYLGSISHPKRVTLTVASADFTGNLLNWLISAQIIAKPPLENIIVVSFDETLHKLLKSRGIMSLFVPYRSVLQKPNGIGIGRVWMTRMAVIRLINHWGYDVQQFDNDAIILRNPQPVFDQFPDSDVVGSRAILPFELGKGPWGFTVCMGAILFRSTPRTEFLWNGIGSMRGTLTTDDQKRLNFALFYGKIQWSPKELKVDKENQGVVPGNGVKVIVLPPVYICRGLCRVNKTISYYVWHEDGGGHKASAKLRKDSISHVWFLRHDWKNLITDYGSYHPTGRAWLEYLRTTPGKKH